MNTFDIIIAVFLVFGFVRGLFNGLFVEVASLVGLIAGVFGAIHFSPFVGQFLANYISLEEQYLTIVSFLITLMIIVVVIALLGKLLTKIADFAALGMLNKLLGGVFGALKLGLILSLVLLVFSKLNDTVPFVSEKQQEESVLYEPIKNLAPTLFPNFLKVIEEETEDFDLNA